MHPLSAGEEQGSYLSPPEGHWEVHGFNGGGVCLWGTKTPSLPQPQVLVSLGTASPHLQLRPVLPAAAQAGRVVCWLMGPPLALINVFQPGSWGGAGP